MNFFAIEEEASFEILGILYLTKKREGMKEGIQKTETEDGQKLFCLFDKYLSSMLDKQKTFHVIYAGFTLLL